jgi:hypothetical protein
VSQLAWRREDATTVVEGQQIGASTRRKGKLEVTLCWNEGGRGRGAPFIMVKGRRWPIEEWWPTTMSGVLMASAIS